MALSGVVVSRKDLIRSPGTSRASTPDANMLGLFEAACKHTFALDDSSAHLSTDGLSRQVDVAPESDAVEFRLFGGPSTTTVKIKLDDTTSESRSAGFVSCRPDSYYFRHPSPLTQAQIAACSITGEQIRAIAQTSWPGCRMPWKILRVDSQGRKPTHSLIHHSSTAEGQRRPKARPGKKVRIARRKVQAIKMAASLATKAMAEEKEAALRNKKTRRNREKKLKRREKERAKKGAGSVDAVDADDG